MPSAISMPSNEPKRSWFKKNTIVPSNNNKKSFSLPPSIEIIKLSTVNGSGIYMPPSPSDEFNSNEDYFGSTTSSPTTPLDNYEIPFCDKLTSSCCKEDNQREFYTPSSHL